MPEVLASTDFFSVFLYLELSVSWNSWTESRCNSNSGSLKLHKLKQPWKECKGILISTKSVSSACAFYCGYIYFNKPVTREFSYSLLDEMLSQKRLFLGHYERTVHHSGIQSRHVTIYKHTLIRFVYPFRRWLGIYTETQHGVFINILWVLQTNESRLKQVGSVHNAFCVSWSSSPCFFGRTVLISR
jgi:hypothetical protein